MNLEARLQALEDFYLKPQVAPVDRAKERAAGRLRRGEGTRADWEHVAPGCMKLVIKSVCEHALTRRFARIDMNLSPAYDPPVVHFEDTVEFHAAAELLSYRSSESPPSQHLAVLQDAYEAPKGTDSRFYARTLVAAMGGFDYPPIRERIERDFGTAYLDRRGGDGCVGPRGQLSRRVDMNRSGCRGHYVELVYGLLPPRCYQPESAAQCLCQTTPRGPNPALTPPEPSPAFAGAATTILHERHDSLERNATRPIFRDAETADDVHAAIRQAILKILDDWLVEHPQPQKPWHA